MAPVEDAWDTPCWRDHQKQLQPMTTAQRQPSPIQVLDSNSSTADSDTCVAFHTYIMSRGNHALYLVYAHTKVSDYKIYEIYLKHKLAFVFDTTSKNLCKQQVKIIEKITFQEVI